MMEIRVIFGTDLYLKTQVDYELIWDVRGILFRVMLYPYQVLPDRVPATSDRKRRFQISHSGDSERAQAVVWDNFGALRSNILTRCGVRTEIARRQLKLGLLWVWRTGL